MEEKNPKDKSTAALKEDLRQLAILKRRATLSAHPYWEWSAETGEYTSVELWRELLGGFDEEFSMFPPDKKELTHEDLVSLIDHWTGLIAPEGRVEAGDRAREFLLTARVNKEFEHTYQIKKADGSCAPVTTTARSVWENKKLVSLFCETRDLTEGFGKKQAAVSLANQADKIAGLEHKVKSLGGKWTGLLKTIPLIAAATVVGVDGIEIMWEQGVRLYQLIIVPVQATIAPRLYDDDLLPSWVTSKKITEAINVMKPYRLYGQVTLWVYDPGDYPVRYAPLAEVNPLTVSRFGEGTTAFSTSADRRVSEMTSNHLSGQTFEVEEGNLYSYSSPFPIVRSDGQNQVLFIEVVTSELPPDKKEIETEIEALKRKLQQVFTK